MPRDALFPCTFASLAEARTSNSALLVPMRQASKQHRDLIGKARSWFRLISQILALFISALHRLSRPRTELRRWCMPKPKATNQSMNRKLEPCVVRWSFARFIFCLRSHLCVCVFCSTFHVFIAACIVSGTIISSPNIRKTGVDPASQDLRAHTHGMCSEHVDGCSWGADPHGYLKDSRGN